VKEPNKNTQLTYADTGRSAPFPGAQAPYVTDRLPTCSLKIEFSFLNANLMVPAALSLKCWWTISVNR
jgi:hypothetical protein